MKRSLIALATVLTAALCAALPLTWRADWPDAKPVETLVHRGTDIELQPTWFINKAAANTNGWTFTTFCQTNAVGPWFGPLPGAFFSHTNDVGAAFYNVMVRASAPGGAVNYTAFARLRMLDSPGFSPGELPLPVPFIDFAKVVALHAPWTLQTDFSSATNSFSAATNSLSASVASLSAATNTLSAAIGGLEQNLATNYYTAAETDDAIDSLAAYYITYTAAGAAFPTRAALLNATVVYSGGVARIPTRNDYAVVLADEAHGGAEWRYIYTVAAGATSGQWDAQYPIETNDYDALSNKPQINGVSLTGNKTGAALGLADETTPVVQPPSLSADLFPIVYQNQFGDTLTIESMADVVFEHPGGAYPYELYKSGFYSRICGFQENGVFAGNGGGTVATFNGRNGESYIWPTLTLSATGGSVVRSAELAEEMSKKMPASATGADIPADATVGAQKINAALAGKVSKSGDTMTGMLTAPSLTVGARGTGSVGEGSVAEGSGTVASGAFAHAEGLNTVASNRSSHSEGVATRATGSQSHAEGFHTSATNPHEHAEGSYNASHTSENNSSATLHSIGIGTSDNDRKNAVETMRDGKTFIHGIGGYDGTNPTATGVKDLATAVNDKANRASPATAGNLAELDANGNPTDSLIPVTNVVTKTMIDANNATFSNAVLSVGLGIDTNTVAVINELVDSAHDLPVSGATSVGALLLALAAAVAALKGNKADKPTNPTNGNLVKVSGTGELQDAGYHFEVRNGVPCIVQYA